MEYANGRVEVQSEERWLLVVVDGVEVCRTQELDEARDRIVVELEALERALPHRL